MKEEKFPIASTRMNLKVLEEKLKSVEKGHLLLKCKSEALQLYFRVLENEVEYKRSKIKELFDESFRMLKEVKHHSPDLHYFKEFCMGNPVCLEKKTEYKFGIQMVTFQVKRADLDTSKICCRDKKKLQKTQEKFEILLEALVDLCGLMNSYKYLKKNLEVTNKRKNALEHTILPKIVNTAKHIEDHLNESEREDFFRLKKIQNLKQK